MPVAHLPSRAVLAVSGADARDFLQGLLTNDVAALEPEQSQWTALLSPQGKVLFAFFLHQAEAGLFIDCDRADAEALARRLMMFRLRKDVTVAPAEMGVFVAWHEAAEGRPADPRHAPAGARWLAPAGAHAADGSEADWIARCLLLGLPDRDSIGHDQLLWLEANGRELNGVSFTKGCYVGQENTARMHHRDRVRKRLMPVQLEHPAAADAELMAGDRVAGQLRGARAGGVQLALFRMEFARAPLVVEGRPVRLLRPAWMPADLFDPQPD